MNGDDKAVGEPEPSFIDEYGLSEKDAGIIKGLGVKDEKQLAKSYVELYQLDQTKVKLPSDDASDKDWSKFYSRVGRPETADDYSVDVDNANEEFVTHLKALSHGANLSKKQFEKIAKGLYEYETGQVAAMDDAKTKSQQEMLTELQKEVGGEEELKGVIANAVAAAAEIEEKHGIKGLKKYFDDSGHGDNPIMIKLFKFIGDNILSDTLVRGQTLKSKETNQRWEKEFHERYPNAT